MNPQSLDLSDVALSGRSFEVPRRRRRPEIRRAVRALRELLDQPDLTQRAFEVGYALDSDVFHIDLGRMMACPAGRRVFRDRPVLLDTLSDREALVTMPDGSFGRAYVDHLDSFGLDPGKLVELRRDTDPLHADRDEDLRWFVERNDLIHDLWHVLTGYGADGLGEGALLAFSLAQRYTRSGALLTLGATSRIASSVGGSWFQYVWCAWRRGRNAVQLIALPYEQLLPLPLETVRRAVRIQDPNAAHPGGVLRAPPAKSCPQPNPNPKTRIQRKSRRRPEVASGIFQQSASGAILSLRL